MGAAVGNDVGDVGQCLHVVEHRGVVPQAPLHRPDVLGPRLPHPSLDGGHQGGGLAADKGAAPPDHREVDLPAAAHHAVAQDAPLLSGGNGGPYVLHRQGVLVPDVEEPLLRADGQGTDGHALQHTVGVALQNGAVHKGPRVPLVAVAGHVLGEHVVARRCAPLPPGGKARAPPAPEAGGVHLIQNFLRRHGEGLLQRLIPAGGQIVVHIGRLNPADVPEGDLLLGGVKGVVALTADPLPPVVPVEKPLHQLPFSDGFLQDLRHILHLHPVVGDIIGKDGHQRSVLTETVAAGTLHMALHLHLGAGGKPLKLRRHLGTAVGQAPGAAADTNGPHFAVASSRYFSRMPGSFSMVILP